MPAHRLGQAELDARVPFTQASLRRDEVSADMNSGREKVRKQDHSRDAEGDTAGRAVVDIRLRELEERGLDRGVTG